MNTRIKAIRESLRSEKDKKVTQTQFAESLHVTRDMIATYESGKVEPTPLFISTLCDKYNVNEEWLRTGSGDMFKEKTRHDQITDFLADVLNDEPDSFRLGFVNALAELSVDEWQMLANICEKFVNNKKNNSED